jgi:transposase
MEIIHERCCGVDVHKDKLVACLYSGRKKEVREFGSMTDDIMGLWEWLHEAGCQMVAMESTGVYWKPVYNILEEKGMKLIVVNAQHIKAVPGRKTDVKDAEWIGDLTRHGLVKPSYIPNRSQRELREMVRYRQNLVEERARELNRVQSILEGANIKLCSVITDISGKSGMAILKALATGQTDPSTLASLAKGRLVGKFEVLCRSLKGSVGAHQMRMIQLCVRHIEELSALIEEMDEDVKEKMEHAQPQIDLMDEIPGIGRRSAERIIAEIGVDMEQFQSASHLCSWAGLVPGLHESAGKRKPVHLRKGNVFLKTTLVECAVAALRNKNSFLYARYRKIAPRRGHKRAVVALAHTMLIAIFHILKNGERFKDLGADFYIAQHAQAFVNRSVRSLEKLGFQVSLSPATD